MKIEINNVYQRKSISKFKVGIVIAIFTIIIMLIVWRLYYEKVQTTDVSSFAEFIGVSGIIEKGKNLFSNLGQGMGEQLDNNDLNNPNIDGEGDYNAENSDNNANDNANLYIPNFTEESYYNIEKIYNLADDGQKRVYLTFDDGPSRDVTPLILDVLKEENIYATFFVLGHMVEKNPDILKRVYEEGHYIGNHGYSHIYSQVYTSTDTVLEEYNSCEEQIRQALEIPEYSTHLFRFPGGSSGGPYDYIKKQTRDILKENNIGFLDWNCLTKDSEGNFPKEDLFENFKQTSYR